VIHTNNYEARVINYRMIPHFQSGEPIKILNSPIRHLIFANRKWLITSKKFKLEMRFRLNIIRKALLNND
jgi:hypothetical protein